MSEPHPSPLDPPSLLPDGRKPALTVLSRLALRKPEAQGWLADALDGRLRELAEAGIEVAVETGGPIGSVLAALIKEQAGPSLAERLVLRCEERGYRESVPLLEVAEAATRRHLTFLYGSLPLQPEPGQLLKISRTQNNLGSRLARLGNWQEAFRSHQEAMEIRKDLATIHNVEEALPDLAASLSNLGQLHGALGNWEEALVVTQEATQILRKLEHEQTVLPALAVSLRHLGIILSEVGRSEEALAANLEALDLHRKLAVQAPLEFKPEIAGDLLNSAGRLRELGRLDEALAMAEEALEIRKELAAEQPEIFLPALARSFHNLGLLLHELGRDEQALAATQEGARFRRQLATANPEAFVAELASSLHNLGNRLSGLDRLEEALAVSEEAIGCYLVLLDRTPRRFLPDLADRLTHRCDLLQRLGRMEELFDTAEAGLRHLIPYLASHREALRYEVASLFGYYQSSSAATDRPCDPEIAWKISGSLARVADTRE